MAQQLYDQNGNAVYVRQSGMSGTEKLAVVAILVMVGIIVATFFGYAPQVSIPQPAPTVQAVQPPRVQPQPVQSAPVVVQPVKNDEPAPAAPVVNVPPQPQPAQIEGQSVSEPAPAPAPVIIVHRTNDSSANQTVTGSGACKVGGNVARRCGK